MGYRKEDGAWFDRCLGKLKPGEPFFVLRAQDCLSPELIRLWARQAKEHDCPEEKIREALTTADEMEKWEPRKFPD